MKVFLKGLLLILSWKNVAREKRQNILQVRKIFLNEVFPPKGKSDETEMLKVKCNLKTHLKIRIHREKVCLQFPLKDIWKKVNNTRIMKILVKTDRAQKNCVHSINHLHRPFL